MHEIINKTQEKQSITTTIYSIALLLIFTNNHNAFMIADYYQLIVLTIVCTLLSIILRKYPVQLNINHFLMLIFASNFLIINLLSSMVIDRGYFLSFLLYIGLYLVMTIQNYNSKDIYHFITAYIHSALIIALLVIFMKHNYLDGSSQFRYTFQFRGNEVIDPNYLAAYIVIPALFSLKRWLIPIHEKWRFYYAISTILICVTVFLTGSRAAFISLVLGIIFIIYYYLFQYKRNTNLQKVFVIAILSFVCVLIITSILPGNIESRLFVLSYNDYSNQLRISHWMAAMDAISKSPLIGYGALETAEILNKSVNHYGDVHNTFISLWLQTGFIGLLCILLLCYRIWKLLGSCMVLKGIFICSMFTSFIISSQLTIGLWTLIILFEMIIQVHKRDGKDIMELI